MRELNEKMARVLASVEFNADLSYQEIAKHSGMQLSAVRYHLNVLESEGIIKRTPLINLAPAGYGFFGIFFTPVAAAARSEKLLLKALAAEPRVTWLSEMSGDFQYAFAVGARHLEEVRTILDALARKFPNLFLEKSVVQQFAAHFFSRSQLPGPKRTSKVLSIQFTGGEVLLDELDKRILSTMTQQSYRSSRHLAQLLGAPLSTVELRLKKLEERGIILGYVYQVDSSKLGMLSHTLLVYSRGMSKELEQELFAFAREHPDITALYSCFGNWDYEINLEVSSAREVSPIIRELNDRFGEKINAVKSLAKGRDLKLTFVPF